MSDRFIAGRYSILKQLGQGAFGHTYLAKDMQMPNNPLCVVKQLKPQSTDEFTIATAKRLFPREAETLGKLGEHPQIPRLLAHLEEDNEFYLVQEYIEGQDLDWEIKPEIKLEESKVVKILDEMLDILTFVHQQRVIHRDIKPSNIMRRQQDGKLVLIDFGAVKEIATQVSQAQKLTVAIGTPGYISREQSNGLPTYASDIYALGMMAIFALTGIDPEQIPANRETGEIEWRNYANVQPKLAGIIDRMVQQDSLSRYPSAMESHQALQEFLNPPPPPLKSSLVKKLLATTALLFTLGGGGYYLWQENQALAILTYKNQTYDLAIDYPNDWVLEKVDDPFGTIARLYPQNLDKDTPVEVTIAAIAVELDFDLSEFSDNAIGKIIQHLPEAKIIDSRQIELNNKPAHRIVYTGKKNNSDRVSKYLQVWLQEADNVFTMTYVAPKDKYQEFSKIVEQTMIPSLVAGEINN